MANGADVLVPIIGMLLGAGGVAFLGTFFRGVSTLRSGAAAREREFVDDTARRLRISERDRDYFRRTAAAYAAQLSRHGVDPVPADLVPPSESGLPR